jgi:hypothetical protein
MISKRDALDLSDDSRAVMVSSLMIKKKSLELDQQDILDKIQEIACELERIQSTCSHWGAGTVTVIEKDEVVCKACGYSFGGYCPKSPPMENGATVHKYHWRDSDEYDEDDCHCLTCGK